MRSKRDSNYEYNKERQEKQFYIDREGIVRKYEGDLNDEIISIHYRIAKSFFSQSDNPEEVLRKLGWILVGSTVYHAPIIHKKPSQAQINKLFELDLYNSLTFLHNGYYVNYHKYQALFD